LTTSGPGALNSSVVAVRIRLGDRISAGIAARAAAVLDDELLAGIVAELLRQDARGDIDRAPGWKRIDDANDPVGIALRRRGSGQDADREDRNRETTQRIRHPLGSARCLCRRAKLCHFDHVGQRAQWQ
jgi:hypothetical protein